MSPLATLPQFCLNNVGGTIAGARRTGQFCNSPHQDEWVFMQQIKWLALEED